MYQQENLTKRNIQNLEFVFKYFSWYVFKRLDQKQNVEKMDVNLLDQKWSIEEKS